MIYRSIKNLCFILLIFILMLFCYICPSFSRALKSEEDRIDTLILLHIIEDGGNLDTNVTRAEFAKIIVRASENKDKISDNLSEAVCNDVSINTPYASYIKNVIENGYMFTYLGGIFKPYDYVTFDDLSRACLKLLSYANEDFRGNQVIGRNLKFRSLGLNENIDRNDGEIITKRDIVNGIYNTLKEKSKDSEEVYGKKIFDKLIVDSDKELNATEYIESNTKGPYFAKSVDDLEFPFEVTKQNIFINAVKASMEELKNDIVDFGYAIYYLDLNNKIVHAYTERQDVSAPIVVRKGYIYKIYYAASSMLVPYRVDIDKYKYMIDSEETKFAFSASGSFKEDDYIVYLCNKMNDVTSAYLESDGKVTHKDDETEPYHGSIIVAFSIDSIK